MAKRVIAAAAAAAFSILFSALPATQSVHSVESVPRIQLGRYVDPANKIDDPLNEVVEIRYLKGEAQSAEGIFAGTGTLLSECRVITALHVLLSMTHGKKTVYLKNPDESLVGEKFDLITNAVPVPNGQIQRIASSFTVLGHGKPLGGTAAKIADEDWAVGYNESCVSEKYKLGFVIPVDGQRLDAMVTRDYYFTAGHSQLPASRLPNGEYALYVDAKCHVTDKYNWSRDYVLTDCSGWDGGSGQLLMTFARKNGVIQIGAGGHPIKLGHAIFQQAEPDVDLNTPNIKVATGFAPFTYNLILKLVPFLEGPVDTAKLAQVALNRRRSAGEKSPGRH